MAESCDSQPLSGKDMLPEESVVPIRGREWPLQLSLSFRS